MTDVRRLPGPGAEKWEWQLHGACRGESTELFFHPEGERGPARAAREAAAKAICSRCCVVKECGEHALSAREPYGVWGGMSESEREAILTGRTRRRGSSPLVEGVPAGSARPVREVGDRGSPGTRQAPVPAGSTTGSMAHQASIVA
nr:WhiB family transcriptional regulator [Pseudofrankia asymbiotica]